MDIYLKINLQNNSPYSQNFFFFQKPALYSGASTIYTNSLYNALLMPYATSGSLLTVSLYEPYYAGVQQTSIVSQFGHISGFFSATQAIDLTSDDGIHTNNTTTMIVSPSLGLTTPVYTSGPQAGYFRIVVPTYDPTLVAYNAGLAVRTAMGSVILSSFVTASPTTNLDCHPELTFYVQNGNVAAGTLVDFNSSSKNAATCDFTPGYLTYNVIYNADGTWTTTP